MVNVKGFVKTRAASLSNPGRKLSSPDAFLRLRFFSSLRVFDSLTSTFLYLIGKMYFNRFAPDKVTKHDLFAFQISGNGTEIFTKTVSYDETLSVDFDPFITNDKPCSEDKMVG